MKNSRLSGSGLLLLEMLTAVLVFAISAAVCMRIFAEARTNTEYSRDLGYAVIEAQSAAESYKALGDPSAAAELLGGEKTNDGFVITYDENWRKSADDTVYILTLTETVDRANIRVEREDGAELFCIEAKAVGR